MLVSTASLKGGLYQMILLFFLTLSFVSLVCTLAAFFQGLLVDFLCSIEFILRAGYGCQLFVNAYGDLCDARFLLVPMGICVMTEAG